jgi:hypothetical protein
VLRRRRGWTAARLAAVLALAACSQGEAADAAAADAPALAVQGWTLEPAALVGGPDAGEEEQLYTVTSVAEDAEGRFYVANFGDKRILVFDSAGTYLRTIGRGGRGPGEFTAPRAVAPVGDDGLLVLDLVPGRISRFRRSDGRHIADARFADDAGIPVDMRATPTGDVVVEFRPRPQTQMQVPAYLARVDTATGAVDRAGAVTLDTVARVQVTGKTEKGKTAVTIDVPFAPRPVWDVQADGAVLYGTGARFEVSRARAGAAQVAFRGTGEPRAVSGRDRDKFFEEPSAQQFKGKITFPRTHPFFTGMRTDPHGTVWLRVPVERGERWEVRDAAGAVQGTFTLPEGSWLVYASRGSVYVVSKDEDGVEALHRYRVRR